MIHSGAAHNEMVFSDAEDEAASVSEEGRMLV